MRLAGEIVAILVAGNVGFLLGAWWACTRVEALVRHIDEQRKEWQ